jgi:hypothetical protein
VVLVVKIEKQHFLNIRHPHSYLDCYEDDDHDDDGGGDVDKKAILNYIEEIQCLNLLG